MEHLKRISRKEWLNSKETADEDRTLVRISKNMTVRRDNRGAFEILHLKRGKSVSN